MTLVELLVAIGVMAILGLALAQLLSTGMTTWRTGEIRRGAYERAQYVFDRLSSDLSTLIPHAAPMPDRWAFEDRWGSISQGEGLPDTLKLYSQTCSLDEDDDEGAKLTLGANMSVQQDALAGTAFLAPTNPASSAEMEYELRLPQSKFPIPPGLKTALLAPRITLKRSASCTAESPTVCTVYVDAAAATAGWEAGPGETNQTVAYFASGSHDRVITPEIDLSGKLSGQSQVKVRIRIEPVGGKESNVRLFETRTTDLREPVFSFEASPHECETGVRLASFYDDGRQYLWFLRSANGPKLTTYLMDGDALRRSEAIAVDDIYKGASVVADGIAYFGCSFPAADGTERDYWNEADSVPPRVRVTLAIVPLSGPRIRTSLREPVDPTAATIPVAGTRDLPTGRADLQHVKIGNEWIEYTSLADNALLGCKRGARGTLPASHAKDAEVIWAQPFTQDIAIPAWGYRSR